MTPGISALLIAAQLASTPVSLALRQAAAGNCKAVLPTLTDTSIVTDPLTERLRGLAAVKCYGDDARAFALLEVLQRKYPNDPDVLYLAAKAHMKAFNDATFAMFRRAPSSYRVHELSAEIFEVEDRYSDAVAEYRKAIEVNPQAVDLHFRLGRALLLENHSAESLAQAAKAFRAELILSPEDAASEFQLGQIAQVETQKPEAKAHFERALALSPNFAQALIALGKIATEERQYNRAIELLKRATDLEPDNETAHYALLTAYRNSGDMARAKAEKVKLDELQKPPAGEFADFLKSLGEKPPAQ